MTTRDDADLALLVMLDAKYHDHLPYGTNCSKCGIEHAAIWPSATCDDCGGCFDDHGPDGFEDHRFVPLPEDER